jgi:hypothetical protein
VKLTEHRLRGRFIHMAPCATFMPEAEALVARAGSRETPVRIAFLLALNAAITDQIPSLEINGVVDPLHIGRCPHGDEPRTASLSHGTISCSDPGCWEHYMADWRAIDDHHCDLCYVESWKLEDLSVVMHSMNVTVEGRVCGTCALFAEESDETGSDVSS